MFPHESVVVSATILDYLFFFLDYAVFAPNPSSSNDTILLTHNGFIFGIASLLLHSPINFKNVIIDRSWHCFPVLFLGTSIKLRFEKLLYFLLCSCFYCLFQLNSLCLCKILTDLFSLNGCQNLVFNIFDHVIWN